MRRVTRGAPALPRSAPALLLAGALASCLKVPAGVFACGEDAECPGGMTCDADGICGSGESIEQEEQGDYECSSGELVAALRVCDGQDDCEDGSDEWYCSFAFACDDGVRIGAAELCDGSEDCEDGTDEEACSDGGFRCGSGDVIELDEVCDGQDDCDDAAGSKASDEASCAGSFVCESGTELSVDQLCDREDQCGDGSDEVPCT